MWWRVLLVLCVTALVSRAARAQAPPASFFDARSNDELRELAADPHKDVLVRRGAATKLVTNLADATQFDAADDAAREFGRNIDPRAVKHVTAVRRRKVVHEVAVGALALAVVIVAACLALARRLLKGAVGPVRRLAPLVVVFCAQAGVVGGYLASSYEDGSPLPFLWFAGLMVPLVLILRVWGVVGSQRLVPRMGRVVAAVAATLAIGFLVVEQVNPAFLEGFGL